MRMKEIIILAGFILLLSICEPKPIEVDIEDKKCKTGRYGLNIKLSHEIIVCNESGAMVVFDSAPNSRYDSLRNETVIKLWSELE